MRCGWKRLSVSPGTLVRLPGRGGIWRVAARSVDREGVRLDLTRLAIESLVLQPTEPGRSVPASDQLHGPTVLHLLDLPNLEDSVPVSPRLYVAAAGPSPGWRRAALMASLDGGTSWFSLGGTAPSATIGTALSALSDAGEALIDKTHTLEVQLLHSGMTLGDAAADRLLAGANLALVGDELIQFGRAAPLGEGRWCLSELARGRRGTGWATASHAVGERFVLIEPEALFVYDPPLNAAGADVELMASSIGDLVGVTATAAAVGEALRPPSPVHVNAERRNDGSFLLHWIRQSRVGWAWLDACDAPLGEDGERYRLILRRADGAERTYELSEPNFRYSAADATADAESGPAVTISVSQVGTSARSRPATLILEL